MKSIFESLSMVTTVALLATSCKDSSNNNPNNSTPSSGTVETTKPNDG